MCLAGIGPVLLMRGVTVGTIPSMRQALGWGDSLSATVFAADGWLTSGYCSAWSLVLFSSLGSDYGSFGWAAAAAALVSAAVSLACGRALDRGGRHRYLRLASAATVASLLFRAFSLGSAPLSVLANMTGAVVTALYNPVVMSVVYARAKASGKPYGFQLALEAAWDAGFVGGCLTSAAVAVCSPFPSLCVLPSVLGVIVVHLCIARLRPGGFRRRQRPSGRGRAVARSLPSVAPAAVCRGKFQNRVTTAARGQVPGWSACRHAAAVSQSRGR